MLFNYHASLVFKESSSVIQLDCLEPKTRDAEFLSTLLIPHLNFNCLKHSVVHKRLMYILAITLTSSSQPHSTYFLFLLITC